MINEQLAAAAAKKLLQRQQFKKPITDDVFKEQADFVKDQSQFITALCTRRAGKSTGLAFKMINKAKKYPGCMIPYVGLTRESSENIMFPVFQELDTKYKLDLELTSSDLEVTLKNKAKIKLFGADQKGFINKLRGPKYPMAVIDEAQAFRSHIEELVDDVFTPATGDYEDGQIILTGTPGPVPKGYFYDCSIGKNGFTNHRWSIHDNPYFPRSREFVANIFEKKGWTDQNPTYRREYLGEWVADLDALVYRFNAEANYTSRDFTDLSEYYFVIGVDLGYSPDPSAFVVGAYSRYDKHLYILEAESFDKMDVSSVAERVKYLLTIYPMAKVVMDLGAQGKMIGEEIRRRHQVPVIAAEKHGKESFIEVFNSDLQRGVIQLVENETKELVDEWSNLIWDAEKDQRAEDKRYPNHCSDACLYLWRYCHNYAVDKLPDKRPARGSEGEMDEYWRKEEERLEREIREAQEAERDVRGI